MKNALIMVRLNIFLAFCFCLVLSSCANWVPLRVKKNFSYCYNPETNYSNSALKLNGYYFKTIPYTSSILNIHTQKTSYQKDTINASLMFFSDGIFIRNFGQLMGCKSCSAEQFNQFEQKLVSIQADKNHLFYNGFNWGLYTIHGDTIKTQSVNRQPWYNPYWYLVEIWYRIMADGTLVQVYGKDLISEDEIAPKPSHEIPFGFIQTNLNTPSDTWLKNEKWFWCQ